MLKLLQSIVSFNDLFHIIAPLRYADLNITDLHRELIQ